MSSLKDLNLKEVSTKTQLEMDFLNAVVNKDFKKLEKFNVRGFLKILSREYELDFTEFLEEYEAFLKNDLDENKKANIQKEVIITPQVDSYSATSSSKSWIVIILLFIIIVITWVIYKYDLLNLLSQNENQNSNNEVVINIIDEAKNNLSNINQSTNLEQNESKEAEQENANSQQNEENLELVITPQAEEDNQSNTQSEEESFNLNQEINSLDNNIQNTQAIFSTKEKIWIGFINLKTKLKSTKITDANLSIDLNKDQLILAGASELSVVDETNTTKTYPAGSSKRFLVQNGRIKAISLDEFKALNGGKEW